MIGCLCFFLISCTDHALENSLKLSGDNRAELEHVLLHYKDNPQKKKAALFLIENMLHNYKESPLFISYRTHLLSLNCQDEEFVGINQIWNLLSKRNVFRSEKAVYDAAIIKADYLIKNIDSAFETWENSPWYKDVDFDTFCDFILPYRVLDEPISNWRDTLRNEYCTLIKDISNPVQAFEKVYREVFENFKKIDVDCPYMPDVLLLNHIRTGTCGQRSVYLVSVLRSLGLPVSYDCVRYWANYGTTGHAWVSYVNKGRTLTIYSNDSIAKEFNKIDASRFSSDGELVHPHHKWESIKRVAAVWRICYKCQQSISLRKDVDMPPALRDLFSYNVSAEYGLNKTVSLQSHGIENSYLT